MNTQKNKDQLLKSAKTYLTLGRILKEKRGAWARREVEYILKQDIPDETKLREIRKIDQAAITRKQLQDKQKKENQARKAHKHPLPNIEPPAEKLSKSSFISYFLFQYRKIARFGRKTGTLIPRYTRLSFTPDPKVAVSLTKIQGLIQKLLDPLHDLIEKSWVELSKEEYNLILAFYDFCDHYYKEFLQDFHQDDLILIQKEFFTVIQKDSYHDLLIEGVKKGLSGHSLYGLRINDIVEDIKKVISEDTLKPSLSQILLSMHMEEIKRFCRLKDVIHTENPPLIKQKRYMASEEILGRIRQYVWNHEQILSKKEKEDQYMDFVTQKVLGNGRNHDSAFLLKFSSLDPLTEEADERSTISVKEGIDDLAFFTLMLLKEYFRVFKGFSQGKVSLVTTEKKILQEKIIPYSYDGLFQKVQEEFKLLNDMMRGGGRFTVDGGRWEKRRTGEGVIGKVSFTQYEESIEKGIHDGNDPLFMILKDLAHSFYEISIHLYDNYAFEESLNRISHLERLELVKEKDIFEKTIPYSKAKLNLNYFLSNKTVLEAYQDLLTFSIHFALFYLDHDLMSRLENPNHLKDEIIHLKTLIQRMK